MLIIIVFIVGRTNIFEKDSIQFSAGSNITVKTQKCTINFFDFKDQTYLRDFFSPALSDSESGLWMSYAVPKKSGEDG